MPTAAELMLSSSSVSHTTPRFAFSFTLENSISIVVYADSILGSATAVTQIPIGATIVLCRQDVNEEVHSQVSSRIHLLFPLSDDLVFPTILTTLFVQSLDLTGPASTKIYSVTCDPTSSYPYVRYNSPIFYRSLTTSVLNGASAREALTQLSSGISSLTLAIQASDDADNSTHVGPDVNFSIAPLLTKALGRHPSASHASSRTSLVNRVKAACRSRIAQEPRLMTQRPDPSVVTLSEIVDYIVSIHRNDELERFVSADEHICLYGACFLNEIQSSDHTESGESIVIAYVAKAILPAFENRHFTPLNAFEVLDDIKTSRCLPLVIEELFFHFKDLDDSASSTLPEPTSGELL